MKNKKYIVLVLLVAIILIPQLALASWWNPFSWKVFSQKEIPVETKTKVISETTKTAKPPAQPNLLHQLHRCR